MCVMNHTTGPRDVTETLEWFANALKPDCPVPAARAREHDRHPDVRGGWADSADFDEQTIRELPLFAELDAESLDVVMSSAREQRSEPGERIVERWQGTRHLYVIIDGTVEIRGLDELLRELGRGDYFGEVAALDWGAGFGYVRTAEAFATSSARLLVLSRAALGELIRRAPSLDTTLRETARQRLQKL
jgi:signal-transduction protein with cAMP-binding, CBS, and nucleotidyltransferase domain